MKSFALSLFYVCKIKKKFLSQKCLLMCSQSLECLSLNINFPTSVFGSLLLAKQLSFGFQKLFENQTICRLNAIQPFEIGPRLVFEPLLYILTIINKIKSSFIFIFQEQESVLDLSSSSSLLRQTPRSWTKSLRFEAADTSKKLRSKPLYYRAYNIDFFTNSWNRCD